MRVTKIAYRRVFNLGNYENKAVEMTAEVGQGEDATVEFYFLEARVLEAGGAVEEAARSWDRANYMKGNIEAATGRPYGTPAVAAEKAVAG